jgi:hypothetical protein
MKQWVKEMLQEMGVRDMVGKRCRGLGLLLFEAGVMV